MNYMRIELLCVCLDSFLVYILNALTNVVVAVHSRHLVNIICPGGIPLREARLITID